MALNQKTPGIYTERKASNSIVVQGVSTGIAGFVGVTSWGDAKDVTKNFCVSWSDFQTKMCYGRSTPFMKSAYLAFAVYSFFLNGGTKVYISRVTDGTAEKAKYSAYVDGSLLVIEAKGEGADGNLITVTVTPNELYSDLFDMVIANGVEIETYSQLSNDETDERYWIDYVTMQSGFVKCVSGTLKAGTYALTGGTDGTDNLLDRHYLEALQKFDAIDDVTLLAIPGLTSIAGITGFIDFLDNHQFMFGAIDAPMTYTTQELKALRQRLSCKNAILLNTWHKINDPLSTVNGKLRNIPTSGAYLGIVANVQEHLGPWRDPAGTMAKVNGALELVFNAQKGDTDILNPLGVISIVTKKNYGICVWGTRSITPDTGYLYVSAILLDIYLRKSVEEACQPLVFEPNKGEDLGTLWTRIISTASSFLEYVMLQGGFASMQPEKAYYVKCDEELNPKSVTDRGYCLTEVGYAYARPAEFIVFRFQNEIKTA